MPPSVHHSHRAEAPALPQHVSEPGGPATRDPSLSRVGQQCLLGIGMLAVYLGLTGTLATLKPLWNDEIFTYHIARRPTVVEVIRVLKTIDLNPPIHYLAVRASQAVLGDTPLALRLPSIVGVAVLCLSLYVFVTRRAGPAYGWVAAALPLATGAFPYAYEARPYGLMLGFAGLALVCWQRASEPGRHPGWLLGLAASLVAAVSTHYYAILLTVPLGLGELVRMFGRRRFDAWMWLAIGSGLLPLAAFLAMVQHAHQGSVDFWARPDWHAIFRTYDFLLWKMTTPLVEILIVLALLPRVGRSPRQADHDLPQARPPAHELAVAVGFALMPLLTLILATYATKAYTERYALPTVVGLGLLIAFLAHRLSDGRAFLGTVVATVLLAWFVSEAKWSIEDFRGRCQLAASLDLARKTELPIVVTDPLFYLQLRHYTSGPLGERLVYLVPEGDSIGPALHVLKPWTPLRVQTVDEFIATDPRFYLYAQRDGDLLARKATERLLTQLRQRGARVVLEECNSDRVLFEASVGDPAKSPAPRSPRAERPAELSNRAASS